MLPLPRPVIAPALGRPSSAGNNKLYKNRYPLNLHRIFTQTL